MNPLALLGLIQLGASLFGSFRASQEASRQQAMMEDLLNRQLSEATNLVNMAALAANRDITHLLAPIFSAQLGGAMSALRGQAAASGLTGSGLELAAMAAMRGEAAGAMGRELLQWETNRMTPLLQAQAQLLNVLGQGVQTRGALMAEAIKAGGTNLGWLPMLLATRPDLFQFNFGFGGQPPTQNPVPGRPRDDFIMPGGGMSV